MIRLLRLLLRTSRTEAVLSALAGAVSGLTAAGVIAVVDAALGEQARWSGQELLAAFLAFLAAVPLTRLASDFLITRLGQRAILELRLQLSRKILAAPLRRLESLGPHRILVALTDDVAAVTVAVSDLPTMFVNVTLILGCLAWLAWISPVLCASFVGMMVLGTWTYRRLSRAGVRRFWRAREKQDALFSHFEGLTEGAKELKLHASRRRAFLTSLERTGTELRGLNVAGRMAFSLAGNWGSFLLLAVLGLAVFGLPRLSPIAAPELTGFVLILLYVRGPLQSLMNALPQIGRGAVALDKVERLGLSLLDDPSEAALAPAGGPPPDWRRLELVGVRHSYRGDADERQFTLGPLDMELRPGEVVFLVGGNGSGKTTFAKVVTGLYAPEEGEVRLDGRTVGDADREAFRQRFSAVFSDFYLFDRLLGLEVPDLDRRARGYLRGLRLDAKVSVHGGRLSTTALSSGQRKRLALLTAYLEDRPICVFDEWAADQDPEFKEVFYRRLLPDLKARGKAVLVITHDDRYFSVADRILKLDFGQLVDAAPPAAASRPA